MDVGAAAADRAQPPRFCQLQGHGGMAVVLGGEFPQERRTFVENEGFDAKANAWRTLAPMPQGRHAAGAASDGDNLYVGGGSFLPGGMGGGQTGELMVFKLP
jgi:hypothetical protein